MANTNTPAPAPRAAAAVKFEATQARWLKLTSRLSELTRDEDRIESEMQDLYYKREHHVMRDGSYLEGSDFAGQIVGHDGAANPTVADVTFKPKPQTLSKTARELLGDLAPPEPEPWSKEPIITHRGGLYTDELVALSDQLEAVREARRVVQEQVEGMRHEWSQVLCDWVRPDYRSGVGNRVAKALVELGLAYQEHSQFILSLRVRGADEMYLDGIGSPMLEAALGDPTDRNSRIRQVLHGAVETGCLAKSAIPAEWAAVTKPVPQANPIAGPNASDRWQR